MEEFAESGQTVESIMQINWNIPHRLHGVVANSQKRQHQIDLLDCDRLILIGIEDGDGGHHKDGQHEQSDVIVCHVAVENVMIVILVDEKIIIFLSDDVLPPNKLGRFELIQEMVVEIRPVLNQPQLCSVAMHHSAIKFSLQQKGYQEPVYANEAIVRTLTEKQKNSYDDCEGGFEYDVHIPKKSEDQFQVYVFQLNDLWIWNPISTLLRHP